MNTPATVIPTCPTCGLPAQPDIVQAFKLLRDHVDLLDTLLIKANAEASNWRRLAQTLAGRRLPDTTPILEPIHA